LQICTLSHNNTSTSAINTLSLHDALPILEVGAHTRSHPHLTQCNDTQLHDELEGGKAALEDVLGAVVTQFCYPYGYLDERVVAATRNAGFVAATTTDRGRARSGDDLLRLPRIKIARSHYLPLFAGRALTAYMDKRR